MVKKQVEIINETGLHARPAANFVMTAKKFESNITVCKEGGSLVSAKSLMKLLAECLSKGTKIEIAAEGADEEAALAELTALVESGFGE